jgi:hypothetical protein
MSNIIGSMLTTSQHGLATSALPDAPVVEQGKHHRATAAAARVAIATALRGLATGSRRLAYRIEPAQSRYSPS